MNEENKNLVPEETIENNEINLNEAVSDSSDVTQSTIENKKKNGNKLKILLFSIKMSNLKKADKQHLSAKFILYFSNPLQLLQQHP